MDTDQTRGPSEIVLTGGPCAGKTSALRYLVDHLTQRGWRVLVVPEAATMLITGGLHDLGHLAVHDRATYLAIQENLVILQADLRVRYHSLAADLGYDKTVILYDRAELDNRAYMTGNEFTRVLHAAVGKTPAQVAAHYDAVVHLVTAADGAATHYTTDNNEARTETPEQAVTLDRSVQHAWLGHPHLVVVGNTGDFDTKLKRTLAAVLGILGEPEPVEIERKWLLAAPPPDEVLDAAVPVHIEQHYLTPGGTDRHPVERRVRARSHDGHTTYFHTRKEPLVPGPGRVEREEVISAETYRHLADLRDPATATIHKTRYCFVHAGQHFELDHLTAPVDAWILEAELVTAEDPVSLPDLLDIHTEVTDNPAWRNARLALGAA